MKQYPFPAIERKINNKDVSIIGVKHIPKFFYENENFFKNIITNHDAVILEQSVGEIFGKQIFLEK